MYYASLLNLELCHIREDNSRISIQTEHKDIGIHINYWNKKWVTNSKGALEM